MHFFLTLWAPIIRRFVHTLPTVFQDWKLAISSALCWEGCGKVTTINLTICETLIKWNSGTNWATLKVEKILLELFEIREIDLYFYLMRLSKYWTSSAWGLVTGREPSNWFLSMNYETNVFTRQLSENNPRLLIFLCSFLVFFFILALLVSAFLHGS